jgi:hypothetical protein
MEQTSTIIKGIAILLFLLIPAQAIKTLMILAALVNIEDYQE